MSDPFALPTEPFTSLSAAQRRLLEQRLRERMAAPGEIAPAAVVRAPRGQPLLLSFGQERLWLLNHIEPGNPAYNSAYLYRLRGTLRPLVLARALVEIVHRHESLRTTITLTDNDLRQVVTNTVELKLDITPVRSLDEGLARARATALAPFDLKRDGLLRPRLFFLGDDDHVLLLVAHHSAWDAWSTQIFWHELGALYAAFDAEPLQPSPLPALAVQYADFAAWQRARLQGDHLEKLLRYWRGALVDTPPLELPTDRPRPGELTYAGDEIEFTWPADLRDALQANARAEGATLFMLLLAGWSALLHRLSGQDAVITGTAIAGRNRREFEPLIGFFVNTLALRTDFSGDPTWRELLQRVRQTTLAAYDHDEMPFEKLIADLRVPRDPARHPLFQTALVLHSAPPPSPALAGIEVTHLPRPATPARFDLALTFTEQTEGLHGVVEFSTDLFDVATIRRWLGHLETLLRFAVGHPDERVARLPLLTEAERTHLLTDWCGAASPYPRDVRVHELFEEHARRAPAAVALVTEEGSVSYGELNARANRLAHHLISLGIAAGAFVAIDLERSVEFVMSVLAVLKIGAAYVPLLPDLPAARRSFMLEDTRAAALICRGAPTGDVPAAVQVIQVGPELIADDEVSSPPTRVTATDAAYVMYTSGSTGRPKGVVIPHRGIVRLVRGQTPSQFSPEQRFLLLASTAFDASTFELWAPLLNGASCAIFAERWPEFETLARAVRTHRVTHLFLTAGLFNQVVDHRPDVLAGVVHLFTGGEAMSPGHAARVLTLWPGLRVTNCYGPTEVTTYATTHELTRDSRGPVPIGRPAPNCRAYILDAQGQPNPAGVPGELHVGGDGLALGYLNLPEMTAERFVPDPFASEAATLSLRSNAATEAAHDVAAFEGEARKRGPADARMYRTGDLARWRADGSIEFLGRLDEQVKIRGYRIEPGEIAAALMQHPDVRDAGVVARRDGPQEIRLVAYVVSRGGAGLDGAALRRFLAERLPDYMVPAAFVSLPELPLTSNGKLDRRQLPAPESEIVSPATDATAPRTPTEEAIAAVWRAILGSADIGVNENFFARGGHSLLAMQATARLGQRLGRDVPLRWWFDHPTIAALAGRIDGTFNGLASEPITVVARTGDLPLSHEEQRLWFLHHVLADPATYHVAWGVRLRGPLDLDQLRRALGAVMTRHEILRTGYVDRDGQPARVIAETCSVPLTCEELPPAVGALVDLTLQRRLSNEARRPFALAMPPLWRALCLRLAPQDHVVAFTAHHLVCDEWSLPIFHRELATAYAARANDAGLGASLPALDIQYADYAAWERRQVSAPRMSAAREFWRDHLLGAPAATQFPFQSSPAPGVRSMGRRAAFALPQTTFDALEKIGRAEHATSFMTWLVTLAALLSRWAGQPDVVIGTPFAHRRQPEVQSLIGFFLNTLPLRVRVHAGQSFRSLLREVRQTVVAAFEHGELPLDEIAAEHAGGRTAGGGALFNVMFVVFDDVRPDAALSGCRADPITIGTGTAKTDLTLFIDRQAPGGPRAVLEFNAAALAPGAVESAIMEYLRIVDEFAASPENAVVGSEVAAPLVDAEAASARAEQSLPPRSQVERELAALWCRVLRREAVGVHDNFFELGGHSLLAMRLVHEMQQQFGRSVPLARLLATPTIAALADFFHGGKATSALPDSLWKGTGNGTPFLYVPGMNGVEFLPAAVAQDIARDRRWFDGLQHPGVDGREPPGRTIAAIALELIRQIRAVQPQGPYALGGFCHGGLVAYEIAHQLEAQGETVAALILWDTFPHRCWRTRSGGEALAVLRRRLFGSGASTFISDRLRFAWHRLALGREIAGRWIRAGLPGERGRIQARVHLAGMRARARYVPRPFHGRVLLVRSRDERVFRTKLPQDGWAGAMLGPCEIVDVPHWHFDLLQEPAVSELAELTAAFLHRADDV